MGKFMLVIIFSTLGAMAATSGTASLTKISEWGTNTVEQVRVTNTTAVTFDHYGMYLTSVSNPARMVPTGRYSLPAPRELEVVGDLVFLIDDIRGFLIFDIQDPTSPQLVSSISLNQKALDIEVQGGYAFLALGDFGLRVYNISNPALPQFTSQLEGIKLEEMVVSGNLLVAGTAPFGVSIVDISNPRQPGVLTTYNVGLKPFGLLIQDDFLYVAGYGLKIFDIANPTTPVPVATITNSYVSGMAIADNTLYTSQSYELIAYNVANPFTPARLYSTRAGQKQAYLFHDGSRLYAADLSMGLTVFDAGTPGTLPLLGNLNTNGRAMEVKVKGALAWLAHGTGGLRLPSVSNPERPFQTWSEPSMPAYAITSMSPPGRVFCISSGSMECPPPTERTLRISHLANPI